MDAAGLVTALKVQVLSLEDDLRRRVDEQPEVSERWRSEHRRVVAAERTASSWTAWRDDRVTQAAVAWVLTSVFIRFCEDNQLVKPVWIAGPTARRQEALDAQLAYFRGAPEATDREWFMQAVDYLKRLPSTLSLVDDHSPLWSASPSGQAVTRLLAFWRDRDEQGELRWDFTADDWSTRFLGDLYQDLSEHAKKTYALLQTPEFVEEFILDQTLEPALKERPLDGFSMIDPTCGSGHFLLGAFHRLLEKWNVQAPGMETQERVKRALDAVHGVDLNPFAVAIARFRLTVAALKACGLTSLERAPALSCHVATGDSLLFGRRQDELPGMSEDDHLAQMANSTEDLPLLRTILTSGQYDVVVGNPPYITVKDKKLNQAYRDRYETCHRKYALTAPFMERFFDLARPERGDQPAGWVGQITSNSFMKREFGSKLIEEFLVKQDLRLVADTSGAYIPGHGTPTVMIIGRHQAPVGSTVRAVLGVRGEPSRPDDAAMGTVWRSLVDHVDEAGWNDKWLAVMDLDRRLIASHPWSLSGGGASDLQQRVASGTTRTLGDRSSRVGFFGIMGSDAAMMLPGSMAKRLKLSDALPIARGEEVRDYVAGSELRCWFPYSAEHKLEPAFLTGAWHRYLWRLRTDLGARPTFSGRSYFEEGKPWFSWHQLPLDTGTSSWCISFANVATHNHFVIGSGGVLFNLTAPVIKLPQGASEDDHLGLLGVLNSSTVCFWLKQNCFNKGNGGNGGGIGDEAWEPRYQFAGSVVQDCPLPDRLPMLRAKVLDDLAQQWSTQQPAQVTESATPTVAMLEDSSREAASLRAQMIAQQEELDWEVYGLYGLPGGDLVYPGDDLPEIALGQRAFEIALARKVAAGEEETAWFSRHGSTPITEIPAHWPAAYQDLVQRRLDLIESNPAVALLESPEHKRRWASESWETMQDRALRGWLLDRLEDRSYWFTGPTPAPKSISQLADTVSRDADLVSVLALWEGRPDVPIVQSLTRLMVDQTVPYLAAYRFKDSGLRKFAAWQETWDLQRREDAGDRLTEPIPVPPKYTNADFRKASWWQARGKLDVPKERFILYPDAGRATDPSPLLGWAGWDHAEQSLALATIIGEREAEGRPDADLIPLVAGLAEVQPWVEQWHADIDPRYGQSLAVFCREQLTDRARQVAHTLDQLAAWRPAATTRGRKART